MFSLWLLLIPAASASITCMDQSGQPVDWFVFYKLPRLYNDTRPHIQNGTGFLYLDSNYKQWKLSPVGMESGDHSLYYTLQQYYTADQNKTFSIMYNDELPNSTVWSSDSGHTKGVSVFDSSSGFWMIHSIPKFPSNQSYEYPSNAHAYGQMGICVSFAYPALGDIATQLFFNQPFIYQCSLPPAMATQFPILARLKDGQFQQVPPTTSQKQFRSLNGQPFTHFAKTSMFGRDLYFDLVASSLRTSLNVETWQHGNASQNLLSWCTNDHNTDVMNARSISLPYQISFSNYNDHSKFAVAFAVRISDPISPWVCIGDINRQVHQTVRGGGTMCIKDATLYSLFSTVISATYQCNGYHYEN